jgi:hypothetical protein
VGHFWNVHSFYPPPQPDCPPSPVGRPTHCPTFPEFQHCPALFAAMIVETFFLMEEKCAMRTQNFQDLLAATVL